MDFEFDPTKSRSNKEKHSIDFLEAQELWKDLERIEIPAKTTDEPRYVIVGKIGERHWTAVITYRGERVRIISVRRSRNEEKALYEGT